MKGTPVSDGVECPIFYETAEQILNGLVKSVKCIVKTG